MWVRRSYYEYLVEENDKLTDKINLLEPLPVYDVFYKGGEHVEMRRITGSYRASDGWLSFYNKDEKLTARFKEDLIISFLRVMNK